MVIQGNKNLDYRILKWKITNNCNYKCSYCFQTHDETEVSKDTYTDIISRLNKDVPNLDIPTVVRLIGGEPTFHSSFEDIISLFRVPFGIYTNLSFSFEKLQNLLNNKYLHHIYCSYHPHKVTDVTKFLDKIILILNSNIHVYVAFMIENYFDSNIVIAFDFLKTYINKNINKKGYLIPKVIEKDNAVDSEYYKNFDYNNYYREYLIPQQKIKYNGKEIYRMDNTKEANFNFNLKNHVCDINTKQIELTNGYEIKKCLLNEDTIPFDKINLLNNQICQFNKCHIFTYEFGKKVKL